MRHRADQLAVLDDGAAAHALHDAAGRVQQARIGYAQHHAFGGGSVLLADVGDFDSIFLHAASADGAEDGRRARMDGRARADGQAVGIERVCYGGGECAADAEGRVLRNVAQHGGVLQE